MKVMKFVHATLVATIIFFTYGCNEQARIVSIKDILQNPADYYGKTVEVEGIVQKTFSLVKIKYMEINDGTGTIKVITKRPLPTTGTKVTVRGVVKSYSIASIRQVVIWEK